MLFRSQGWYGELCGWLYHAWACLSARWPSQAHTSLKRKSPVLDIPRSSVFKGNFGQPCAMSNHLTEVLDEGRYHSYSERTLQPGRTPGRGSRGRTGNSRWRTRGGWAADPSPRFLNRVARLSRRPRSRSRGLFIGPGDKGLRERETRSSVHFVLRACCPPAEAAFAAFAGAGSACSQAPLRGDLASG